MQTGIKLSTSPETPPEWGPLLEGMSRQIESTLGLSHPINLAISSIREHPFSQVAICRFLAGNEVHSVVVKVFKSRSGRLVERTAYDYASECFAKLTWLYESLSLSDGCTVPRPLAVFERAVAMELAPGKRLDQVFARSSKNERLAAFCATGGWIAALARLPLEPKSAQDLFQSEAHDLFRVLDAVSGFGYLGAAEISRWRAFLEVLIDRAQRKFEATSPLWCHADFIASNIFFLSPTLVTVIDVDGIRPGFWPRDVASILYDLKKRRFTNVVGLRYAQACCRVLLGACGYSWQDLQTDEFRFYWARELLGNLHNLLKYSTDPGRSNLKTRYLAKVTAHLFEKCIRGKTE